MCPKQTIPTLPLSLVAVGPGAIVPLGCAPWDVPARTEFLGGLWRAGHGAKAELHPWRGWGVLGWVAVPHSALAEVFGRLGCLGVATETGLDKRIKASIY